MQLLAGVKCCTGRKLTNHPHFEDKILRQATREVKCKYLSKYYFNYFYHKYIKKLKIYQIYALQSPELIFETLKKYQTDFLILEDSICLSPSRDNQCSLKEILDLVNGHVTLFILFN